jgi:hypothetical protein
MNSLFLSRSKLVGLVLVGLASLVLSACVTLTPEQVDANSITRHEQRADGIQDPMKQQ